ncbi:MAG: 2,3-bisphosphoglycerate-independent phosphoglycerate mutase [Bdellovibrionales bacterium]
MPSKRPKPVVLCILDGWGYREERQNNAVALANTPCWDDLWANNPHSLLRTDGESVGLPKGQMGNSEVGHMTLGAGRVLWQDLPRIDQAIAKGELKTMPALQKLIADLKGTKKTCHLMGLLSPGGIHSHMNHIAALANHLAANGVRVAIHGFLDGRDRPPKASTGDVTEFMAALDTTLPIKIATLCGRYYAMDRDQRWDRTALAYNMLVNGDGDRFGDLMTGILTHHALGITDEFMTPLVDAAYTGMADGDALIFCNFRADRSRQMTASLCSKTFNAFARSRVINFSHSLAMSDYGGETAANMTILFPHIDVTETLAEILSRNNLKQFHTAETEKYPHVTFYFNVGREVPWPGEDRFVAPSPKVATYDLKPKMSAPEVTDKLVEAIETGNYDFILVNYANPDMVGHTGIMPATIEALEYLDSCLRRIVAAIHKTGGVAIITADHGNAEEMWDEHSHSAHTQHSLNPVPCILVNGPPGKTIANGTLADIAPTLLALLNLPQPAEMTGKSLLQ